MSHTQTLPKNHQLVLDDAASTGPGHKHRTRTSPQQNTPTLFAQYQAAEMVKTLWDEFTAQEKADCVDKLWEKKFNSQYRWDVKGRLRNEIWTEKTLPLLNRLENDNYPQIYGTCNRHMMRAFHISLLGQTNDSAAADPVVLIIVDSRKIGQKMKQIFENHQHFLDLNTGLRIEAIDVPESRFKNLFRLSAGESALFTENLPIGLYRSVCGTGVLVTKLPPTEESIWKRATIGGVICNPKTKEYFCLTVAHCFNFDASPAESSDDESSTSTRHSQPSESSDMLRTVSDEDVDLPEQTSYRTQLPKSIYGGYLDTSEARSLGPMSDREPLPRSLAYVGEIDLRHNHFNSTMTSDDSTPICMDLDWALIRVRDSRFMQKNEISTPWNTILRPDSILLNSHQPEPQAILAANTSGVRKVGFSGTETSVRLPWATSAQTLWTVEADLGKDFPAY